MRTDVDFNRLVLEHHAALYRFARSMTHNDPDACDLVQETFLRWAQHGHQLADISKVKSWLFTTLYREAARRARRLIRFPQDDIEATSSSLPDVPPIGPGAADGTIVLEALSQIDEVFRAPVSLFYLEDYSYSEIAEILGIPIGTVKSRIARGVASLQRRLSPRPPLSAPVQFHPRSLPDGSY